MRACFVNSVGVGLSAALWSCGSGVVDVGTLPDDGDSNENQGPDAGAGGSGGSGSGCNIPDLGRYRLVFDSDGGKLERRIYTMRADGSELEAVTPAEELAREPSMAPDGSQLAYATPEGLKLLDVGTGASELLMAGADQVDWSPTGEHLAYRLWGEFIQVLRMSDRVEIGGGFSGRYPDFGLDVQSFAYSTFSTINFSYAYSVVTGPVDVASDFIGSSVTPPTTVPVTHPTISPDGIWVAAAFVCPGSAESSLWASPIAVSTPACEGRRVTPVGAVTATNPKWGPGVLIAYERGEPPRDIAIIAADTGEECVIQGAGDDRNPSWVASSFVEPE